MERVKRPLSAVATAGTLLLAGCGGEAATGAPTDPQQDTAAWQQQDPCELLTPEEVKRYLGDEAASPKRTDDMDRPRCEWKGEGLGEIKLSLWQPPAPEIVTDRKDVIEVGDRKGYIVSETDRSCHLDVESEPAFLQFEVFATESEAHQQNFCQAVAEIAEKVLAELRW